MGIAAALQLGISRFQFKGIKGVLMKKHICLLFCAVLLVIPAFSAVTINGFGRGIFSVLASDNGTTLKTASGVSWGTPYRVGFGISGDFGFTGFRADVIAGTTTMNGGDEQKLWVKLLGGMMTLTGGVFQDNTLRSDACFGAYDWLRGGLSNKGEDFTFKRINVTGLGIAFQPTNELYVTIGIPFSPDGSWDLIDSYGKIQATAGYKLNDRMHLKVGYFGNLKEDKETTNITVLKDGKSVASVDTKTASVAGFANIGFDMIITPQLFMSAGIFSNSTFDRYTGNFYVRQSRRPITLHGMVSTNFGKEFDISVGTGIDYFVGNGMQCQIDLRTEDLVTKSGQAFIGLAGLSKVFSNGIAGIGFELALNTNLASVNPENLKTPNAVTFAVPVKLQYNF